MACQSPTKNSCLSGPTFRAFGRWPASRRCAIYGGTVCGAVSIFQNITEIKRREQERDDLLNELDRSNRELSRFSYIVSHDLQAPVRTVRALTELLVRREGPPPEEASRLAEMIDQAAESMQRLIGSLLQYAQAGRGELNRQAVSVEDVIESVRLSLGVSIAKTEARIICQSLPKIDADPLQLGQLFQNLIANAIDYRQPGRSRQSSGYKERLSNRDGSSRLRITVKASHRNITR